MAEIPAGQLDPQDQSRLDAGAVARSRMMLLALAGVAAIIAIVHCLLIDEGLRRFLMAYLVAWCFIASLSLGGMIFVLIQHLTRAGWSVLVRRPAEILAANMPIVAILFLPIAVSVASGHGQLYPWAISAKAFDEALAAHHDAPTDQPAIDAAHQPAESDAHAETSAPAHADPHADHAGHDDPEAALFIHQTPDELTAKKRPWLNRPFFLIRVAVYLAIWIFLGRSLWLWSTRQDESGDARLTTQLQGLAAPGVLLYAVTVTFGAWDIIMSLNPHWYSTIFGVYFFGGALMAALAVIILSLMSAQRAGCLRRSINTEHYHDLGKLLFAFVFFWGYIAFSQYMLLWYANVPETTMWLRLRGATTVGVNAWSGVILLLLAGHFIIPFLGLLSRHAKRNRLVLGAFAAWLFVMHYLDLAWLILPELGPQLSLGPAEIGLLVALTALFAAFALSIAVKAPLAPTRDPRLSESMLFHNAY